MLFKVDAMNFNSAKCLPLRGVLYAENICSMPFSFFYNESDN